MLSDFAVYVNNLSKCYQVYEKPFDRIKQAIWRNKQFYKDFWALQKISFEIKKGEAFGIIGRNGSGKSTLLQLICKTLTPTTGQIEINGRIAALLELGAGFNPEFTGRENVYINGAILGFNRNEIDAKFDEITAFADIGEYIDQPVKNYSSGMFVRLAFAVQACTEPDILIVDEALSVGDIFFQQKCHARMEELLKRNTSIIFVTHDMAAIEKYCHRVMLLEKGQCRFIGNPNEAVERYYFGGRIKSSTVISSETKSKLNEINNSMIEWPSPDAFLDLRETVIVDNEEIAKCGSIAVCNERGEPTSTFRIGETACFYYECELLQDIHVPIGGIVLTNRMNLNIHGKSSLQFFVNAPNVVTKGSKVRFRQTMVMTIQPGEYVFQVGFATIKAEDYFEAANMPHSRLNDKMQEVLRVRQAGVITVVEPEFGIRIPFHGFADLQGDCALAILPASENFNSQVNQ